MVPETPANFQTSMRAKMLFLPYRGHDENDLSSQYKFFFRSSFLFYVRLDGGKGTMITRGGGEREATCIMIFFWGFSFLFFELISLAWFKHQSSC